ncbi:RagB/SusD family nutrient uptake outer membrane protein, partial [Bacteroidota bacterium]
TIVILVIIIGGCEQNLMELEPRDTVSTEIAYSTLEGLEGAIYAVYDRGKYPYSEIDFSLYKIFYTDIVRAGTGIVDQRVWLQMATFAGFDATNTGIKRIWEAYYSALNKANTIIALIDEVEYNIENPISVQRRNTVLGEALYFRAFYHLNLVEYWDNIFLSDRVYDDPNYTFELSPKEDVYDLIVADLKEAIPLLPEAADVNSRGKVTKGVARHLLSLVYLDLEIWSEAAILAEKVIADPSYDFAPIDQIFSNDYQDNSEILFSWQFIIGDFNYSQRASAQLAPYYDRINGVNRTFEQGARPWHRMSPTEYYWSLFEQGDLRLEAWHKLYWIYDIDDPSDPLPAGVEFGDTVTIVELDAVLDYGERLFEPTTTKYWENGSLGRTLDMDQGYRNIIQFRYSEAYLVAAEAYMNSGNATRGQELFDALRARAGVGSIDLNYDNLLDEQARELGFEGRRYPMLKRLGILLERVQARSPEIGANMLSIHERWPLPKDFVDLTGVKQNEGYE